MLDVSDGIDSDVRRIMERSRCGATVHLDRLPLSEQLERTASRYGWDSLELAATSGEDYCLLLTVDGARYQKLAEDFEQSFGRPLTEIGSVADAREGFVYRIQNQAVDLRQFGFDHFAG